MNKLKNFYRDIFLSDLTSGALLFFAAILAILIANSKFFDIYHRLFDLDLFGILPFLQESSDRKINLHWLINEVFMSFFFLLIGLELKQEMINGELSSKRKLFLPLICAIGGVIFPIFIYFIFNHNNPQNMGGFAISCATDIAFTYGIISFFKKVFTKSLQVFIIALAIIDDVIAILLIAIFYTKKVDYIFVFFIAIFCIFTFLLFNKKIKMIEQKITYYWVVGVVFWILLFKSEINPTLSGTMLGLIIPINDNKDNLRIKNGITKLVNFLILPFFAFANFGIYLGNISTEHLLKPLIIGSAFGLFFGKQFGILSSAWIAIKLKICHLPRGTNWQEFYLASIFTGIGFTMSIFIATIAFHNDTAIFNDAKIGILAGSMLSTIWGIAMIHYFKSYSKK